MISLFWLEEWWIPGWVQIYPHSLVLKSLVEFHFSEPCCLFKPHDPQWCWNSSIRAKAPVNKTLFCSSSQVWKLHQATFHGIQPATRKSDPSVIWLADGLCPAHSSIYSRGADTLVLFVVLPVEGKRSAGEECCVLEGSKAPLRIYLNLSSFELLTPQGNLFCKEHLPGLSSQSCLLASSKALSAGGLPTSMRIAWFQSEADAVLKGKSNGQ